MSTVFSHIIQKRFSQVNEDVATDALAYILESSNSVQRGMSKLLRGILPDLPLLNFRTQQTDGAIRPDMWGFADAEPRVFIENKFWAGLTDNQPISYLQKLATYPQPTFMLVIAPAAREQALWRELTRRLLGAGIIFFEQETPSGVSHTLVTQLGPVLSLTSWSDVLSILEHEAADDPGAREDLHQLRALCEAADIEAFTPVSNEELSDQRHPAFVLQLSSVIQSVTEKAIAENVVSINKLRPQASWDRIGRYIWLSGEQGAGVWFGIHFGLWKKHGMTPLWLLFSDSSFGRAQEVRRLIEPWATGNGFFTTINNQDFAMALDLPTGEEKDCVINSLLIALKSIADELKALPAKIVLNGDKAEEVGEVVNEN